MSAANANNWLHDLTLRDGLMAQPTVPTSRKLEIVEGLLRCGIRSIEAARFPLDGKYPQFDDALNLLLKLQDYRTSGLRVDVFAFGDAGISEALCHPDLFDRLHIPCFTSDAYARYAWGEWSWTQSLAQIELASVRCEQTGVGLTVGIGTIFGCPFKGAPSVSVAISKIAEIVRLGVTEIMLGDTIGLATPEGIVELVALVKREFPTLRVRVHCHNGSGRALLNTWSALKLGCADAADTSLLGLGGEPHPYFIEPEMTANGNCATEELVALLGDPHAVPLAFRTARELATIIKAAPSRACYAEVVELPSTLLAPAQH